MSKFWDWLLGRKPESVRPKVTIKADVDQFNRAMDGAITPEEAEYIKSLPETNDKGNPLGGDFTEEIVVSTDAPDKKITFEEFQKYIMSEEEARAEADLIVKPNDAGTHWSAGDDVVYRENRLNSKHFPGESEHD